MKKIYAVYQEGVFRRECCGIFNDFDKAKDCAKHYSEIDVDNYHSYKVFEYELNKISPSEIVNVYLTDELNGYLRPIENKEVFSIKKQ